MRESAAIHSRVRIVHPLLRAREYQDRPQFEQLCGWWKNGGIGVCSLVGIGGAGKTAIVEHFLRLLPGVVPSEPSLQKDDSLPTPAAIFVFSFYDAPNPDAFFSELADWLSGMVGEAGVQNKPTSFGQLLPVLERVAPVLFILDGLEKVQDEGKRGGFFGQIEDERLRDFILRVSDGLLWGLSVVITTRFPLFEPLVQKSPFYQSIRIETLEPKTALALLRARGVVSGSDEDLLQLAETQGFHALTLDLVGGYIAHFCGGDPIRFISDRLEAHLDDDTSAVDPGVWALRMQERRFARLAERYREALAQSNPVALAILQRVCLFRLGIDIKTFASIFLAKGLFDGNKIIVSSFRLLILSEKELKSKFFLLVQMRLLEATVRGGTGLEVYTAHPAVRDGFLQSLSPNTARRGHEAALKGLEASLGGRPGERYPSDPAVLDIIEEIIYHAIESRSLVDAWDTYWNKLGGYRNLGWRLASYDRGERIGRTLSGGMSKGFAKLQWPYERRAIIMNEWALYLSDLGNLSAAAQCFREYIDISLYHSDVINASVGQQNLALVYLHAGQLFKALEASEIALSWIERFDNPQALANSLALAAYVRFLRGDTQGALSGFREALAWQRKRERMGDRPLYSNRGVWYSQLLARLGRYEAAKDLTEENDRLCYAATGEQHHQEFASCRLLLADISHRNGDLIGARDLHMQAYEWALARGAQELLCWCALIRGQIELSQAEKSLGKSGKEYIHKALRNIDEGLHIARCHGFSIYHVDLLVLGARVYLALGDLESSESCARTALFGLSEPTPGVGVYGAPVLEESAPPEKRGIFPEKQAGLPELLAATNPECSYGWGESDARKVLAEVLLLRAARLLGRRDFTYSSLKALPEEVQVLVRRARRELEGSWKLRIRMEDPRAQEVELRLERLGEGVLVEDNLIDSPFEEVVYDTEDPTIRSSGTFDVFLSHSSGDKAIVRKLGEALKIRGLRIWLDEWELVPGRPWQEALEEAIQTTRTIAILVGENGFGPWEVPEMRAALQIGVSHGTPVIPVLLPNAPVKPNLPPFLSRYTWVDLRNGLTKEGLDRLEWGITGVKPKIPKG